MCSGVRRPLKLIDFMQWIQSFSTPVLDQFFLMVTNLANELLFIFCVVIIYWCVSKEKGLMLVCSLCFSIFINIDLKYIWKVPRPFAYSDVIRKDFNTSYGYSFPSGHSQMTASFFTSLWCKFPSRIFLFFGIVMTTLLGFSRIYLGVHTPLDVFCGILIGILLIIAVQSLSTKILRNKKYWMLYLLFIPGILGMLFTEDPDILKVAPLFFGFLFGFSLEQKFLDYQVKAKLSEQFLKVFSGILILLFIQIGLKWLGSFFWLNLLRYFLTGFAITFLCPFLFSQLQNRG